MIEQAIFSKLYLRSIAGIGWNNRLQAVQCAYYLSKEGVIDIEHIVSDIFNAIIFLSSSRCSYDITMILSCIICRGTCSYDRL